MSDDLASGGCWADGQRQEPRSAVCTLTPPHPVFQQIRTAILVAGLVQQARIKMRNGGK